jgi:EAL domain-containing protein (putative c-di-GMP-specific phosphodiesterase class I)
MSISAQPNTVVAFESLLRVQINGVAHGPADIVAAAEADRSIIDIDRWVLNEAIRQAVARPRLNIWINASQISIAHPTFLNDALTAMTASRTLGRMTFELTETADVDATLLLRRLDALKVRALTLMIDDVRDGYAKIPAPQRGGIRLQTLTGYNCRTADFREGEVRGSALGKTLSLNWEKSSPGRRGK